MEYEYRGYWSERDKQLYESTNWAERNYEELPVEDDTIEGTGYFYSKNGNTTKKLTFVKYIRPNPIYPPYYGPIETAEVLELKKGYVGPMYDGHDEGQYQIHDRFEDQYTYDTLSR